MPPKPSTPTHRRWWRPRLSVRGLMLAVLVIGGLLGWTIGSARRQEAVVVALSRQGGRVLYDWEYRNGRHIWKGGVESPGCVHIQEEPPWTARWFGPDALHSVTAVEFQQLGREPDLAVVAQLRFLPRLESVDAYGLDGPLLEAVAQAAPLRILRIRSPHSHEELAHLRKLRHLEVLTIVRSNDSGVFDDSDLANVAELTNLRWLIVPGDRLTDAGLAALAGLTRLERLELYPSQITAAGLAHLRRLDRLEDLTLTRSNVASLRPIAHLARLRKLNLAATPIDNAGLAAVASLSHLTELDLAATRVTDAGLAHLAGLRDLGKLDLCDVPGVDGTGLGRLAGMTKLHVLNLANTRFGDAGARQVAIALPRLTSLDLSGTPITDAALVDLARLTNLSHLNLGETAITEAGLAPLAALLKSGWVELPAHLIKTDPSATVPPAPGAPVDTPLTSPTRVPGGP